MSQLLIPAFTDIVQLIASAKQRAIQAVNTSLIDLYWQVGEIISKKIAAAEWGDGVVDQLAAHLAQTQPGLRGFTRPNQFRMRQFYDTYKDDQKVSALLRQLPWTHNLTIMSQSKRPEEREFYQRMAIKEQWSSRELERQFKAATFERKILEPVKSLASGATFTPRSHQRLQRCLHARIPRPARCSQRIRPSSKPARQTQSFLK
jgi:predicted nuclease of restriction endonuclease-like (RecB) superfamily